MSGSNSTTTGLPAASTLTGSEVLGVVQSGSNVKTTIALISTYIGASSGYSADNNFAIGLDAAAGHQGGIAIGKSADSRAIYAIAIGTEAYAAYENTIAIGVHPSTTGNYDIAIGYQAKASYLASIAIGQLAHAYGNQTIGIGKQAHATTEQSIAIGYLSVASGITSVAIGDRANATNFYSVAIGGEAYAAGSQAIAIGLSAHASYEGAISIGAYTTSNSERTINIGSGTSIGTEKDRSISIGTTNRLNSYDCVAIGYNVEAYGQSAIGLGKEANTLGIAAIAIGASSYVSADYAIAIGYQAKARGAKSTAIGYKSKAQGHNSIAIGGRFNEEAYTTANGNYAIAVGSAYALSPYAISIGLGVTLGASAITISGSPCINYAPSSIMIGGLFGSITVYATQAILIGNESYVTQPHGIAIGYQVRNDAIYGIGIGKEAAPTGTGSMAIGAYSACSEAYSMAIGFRATATVESGLAVGYEAYSIGFATVAIGNRAKAVDDNAIAIGQQAYANGNLTIAIGYEAAAVITKSIALGAYTYATNSSIAIGYESQASGVGAISILGNVGTTSTAGIAIGLGSAVSYDYSVALGNEATDFCSGDFVVRGVPTTNILTNTPTKHEMKVSGITSPGEKATAVWNGSGINNWNFFVTAPDVGTASNGLVLDIVDNSGLPDQSFSITFETPYLIVNLGTDGSGNVTTTLQDVADALIDGFGSAFNEGSLSTIMSNGVNSDIGYSLVGGVDAITPTVLTTDADTPGAHNMPVLVTESLARITGSVIGYDPTLLTESDPTDAATFVLAPSFVIRDTSGTYSFIGTPPVYTLENSTEGAIDWVVPTLTIVDNALEITVTGEAVQLNWLGFLTFEANA